MNEIIIDFTQPQTAETIAEMKQDVVIQLANFIQSNAADIDEYTQMDNILHAQLEENLIVKRAERLTMNDLSEDITIKEMKAILANNAEMIEFQDARQNRIDNFRIIEAAEHLAIRNYLKEQDEDITDEAIDVIFDYVQNEVDPDAFNFAQSVDEAFIFAKKFDTL